MVVKSLVTVNGECFRASLLRSEGSYDLDRKYEFRLEDMAARRGTRGLKVIFTRNAIVNAHDFQSRENVLPWNAVRKAFDKTALNFDLWVEDVWKELKITNVDAPGTGKPESDETVRQYLVAKLYWLGYRFGKYENPVRTWVDLESEVDLDYLGVSREDLRRVCWRMEQEGLSQSSGSSCVANPTEELIKLFESGKWKVASPLQTVSPTTAHDRRLQEMALEEAAKSKPEDSRVHPNVGVVVVKDGQVLSTAYRGEITGSHAEFIALEKKLGDQQITGATIYTTLEPCTSRKHPKVPCAERLRERKVARVVIGMLDPNPVIRGAGLLALREANITTDLFPPDLMAQAEEMNREFIRLHRPAQSKETPGSKASTDGPQKGETGAEIDPELDRMTSLMSQMRANLSNPKAEFVREFFVLPNRRVFLGKSSKPRFIHYEEDYENLRGMLDVLEERGFVVDLTSSGSNTPIYRMAEPLVKYLRESK